MKLPDFIDAIADEQKELVYGLSVAVSRLICTVAGGAILSSEEKDGIKLENAVDSAISDGAPNDISPECAQQRSKT